jgi:hypothetical protein
MCTGPCEAEFLLLIGMMYGALTSRAWTTELETFRNPDSIPTD